LGDRYIDVSSDFDWGFRRGAGRRASRHPRRGPIHLFNPRATHKEVFVMYRSFFPRDMLAEMSRLQRDVEQALNIAPTIRGFGRSGFPALNVGSTPQAIEVVAFAPGVDPQTLEASLDRGLLTIAGERKTALPGAEAAPGAHSPTPRDAQPTVHINERFNGAFRRMISLPDDADPDAVTARYQDGVVHITVQRRASSQPRRITIA
jgi:HSP20 family protein